MSIYIKMQKHSIPIALSPSLKAAERNLIYQRLDSGEGKSRLRLYTVYQVVKITDTVSEQDMSWKISCRVYSLERNGDDFDNVHSWKG